MIGPKSVARGKQLFDALSDGGAVIDSFKANFFSPGFGMVKDRFGTHWIVSAEGA
jgi:PhnB protein